MLLICLAVMLVLAISLYQWIPNRKIVPDIEVYAASEEIKDLLEDDIIKRSANSEPILSYTVTSTDLNNYQKSYDYVPGKPHPFAEMEQSIEPGEGQDQQQTDTSGQIINGTTDENDTKVETKEPSVYSNNNGSK